MRMPMSARDQLLAAREMGHELAIEEGTRVVCTCGYRSTTRRSKAALNGVLAWHLGKVIADAMDTTNGQPPAAPPAPRSVAG